jgi:hypothetical protein
MLLTCKHPPVHEFSQFGNPNENGNAESSGLIILRQATGAKSQSQLSLLKQSGEKRKEGNKVTFATAIVETVRRKEKGRKQSKPLTNFALCPV